MGVRTEKGEFRRDGDSRVQWSTPPLTPHPLIRRSPEALSPWSNARNNRQSRLATRHPHPFIRHSTFDFRPSTFNLQPSTLPIPPRGECPPVANALNVANATKKDDQTNPKNRPGAIENAVSPRKRTQTKPTARPNEPTLRPIPNQTNPRFFDTSQPEPGAGSFAALGLDTGVCPHPYPPGAPGPGGKGV